MTYFLNDEERAIVNGTNGKLYRPSCYTDLSGYHSYLEGRGHHKYAQSILREVFENNEKIISKMIASSQKHAGEDK